MDVVCFGEVLWDLFEVAPETYRREIGGAPANVAVVLARLGVRSRLCGAVGTDRFGVALADRIAALGVDTSALARRPERTGLTFVTRDAAGEPSFLFYRHNSADMSHAESDLSPTYLTEGHKPVRFALVGTSTFVPGPVRRTSERFLEYVQDAHTCRLVVDLNVRAHLWKSPEELVSVAKNLLASAALVKASEADLHALMAIDGRSREAWLAETNALVFVTDGGNGATVFRAKQAPLKVPTILQDAVDATGAGDGFLAGVLAVLCQNREESDDLLREAAAFGHAVAAVSIRGLGGTSAFDDPAAVAPLRAELDRLGDIGNKRAP